MRRHDRTEWPAPARGADASRREAASRDITPIRIARPLPSSRRARVAARGVRSTSSRVRIHKAVRQPRCPSWSPLIVSTGHAAGPGLEQWPIHRDQLEAAMRAKRGLLPSRHRMAIFRTCSSRLIRIHGPAALGTEAYGCVSAAMIEIGTGRAQVHSHLVPHGERARGTEAAPHGRHAIQTAYPPARPERCLKVHSQGGQCAGILCRLGQGYQPRNSHEYRFSSAERTRTTTVESAE